MSKNRKEPFLKYLETWLNNLQIINKEEHFSTPFNDGFSRGQEEMLCIILDEYKGYLKDKK